MGFLFLGIDKIQGDPEAIGKGDKGRHQMGREPVMGHIRTVHQTALYHIPAQKSLEGSQKQQDQTLPQGGPVQFFLDQKIEEGDDEHQAQKSAQKPVEPFPKIDLLEVLQAKMIVEQLVFGILFVQFKGLLPLFMVHGGKGACDQFVIGDRKPGIGEPGDPAHEDHDKDEKATTQQPIDHSLVLFHFKDVLRFISLPFSNMNLWAAPCSLGISPSRIASLMASLIIPISLEGFRLKASLISSPETGG